MLRRKKRLLSRKVWVIKVRWVLFVASFFLGVVFCFWGYAWSHREAFVQTALGRLYPMYSVSVGSVAFDAGGTVVIRDIALSPSLKIPKVLATSSYGSWLRWVLVPDASPLHLSSLSITASALPPDVITRLDPFVRFDVLTVEMEQ